MPSIHLDLTPALCIAQLALEKPTTFHRSCLNSWTTDVVAPADVDVEVEVDFGEGERMWAELGFVMGWE
ncbi:Hypothetical predicted protein [Olea europaea subsp. europaea]|uniref:Uncharacterized protein n=1 Tax=Olea europaea subsp. europaea TaxID=158383 RepID=A0A8S0P8H5_OLEEU|nr:Hypothetical predicted protein [Olea europaea subsp. europaea]